MKKWKIALVLLLIFLCGCSTEVAQTNDGFTANLLMYSSTPWYTSTIDQFRKENPDLEIEIEFFNADAFDLEYSREYKDVNLSELQNYYDNVTNTLRTGTAGDLVFGDALYLDWPEVTPLDWHKLKKSGVFAPIESDDSIIRFAKYASTESDSDTEENWTFLPITFEFVSFTTHKDLAKKWKFDFLDGTDTATDDTILEFLEKCAAWVEEYGEVEGAPSIMPDYEFRRLKGIALDICGVKIVDYETGTADFDNDTVRRLLEALKTIETDVEDSGLGDQGLVFYRLENAETQRFLIWEGYLLTEDYISFIPFDVNREHHCCYATRWAAIPASSANKEIAVRYLETMFQDSVEIDDHALAEYYRGLPAEHRNASGMHVVIPGTWQYALSELFNEYYSGRMDIDEFVSQVQSRLEVYITE